MCVIARERMWMQSVAQLSVKRVPRHDGAKATTANGNTGNDVNNDNKRDEDGDDGDGEAGDDDGDEHGDADGDDATMRITMATKMATATKMPPTKTMASKMNNMVTLATRATTATMAASRRRWRRRSDDGDNNGDDDDDNEHRRRRRLALAIAMPTHVRALSEIGPAILCVAWQAICRWSWAWQDIWRWSWHATAWPWLWLWHATAMVMSWPYVAQLCAVFSGALRCSSGRIGCLTPRCCWRRSLLRRLPSLNRSRCYGM